MAEISLQRPGVVASVSQGMATGMAEHMGMDLNPQLRSQPGPFNHPRKARRTQWRTNGLALVATQCP